MGDCYLEKNRPGNPGRETDLLIIVQNLKVTNLSWHAVCAAGLPVQRQGIGVGAVPVRQE